MFLTNQFLNLIIRPRSDDPDQPKVHLIPTLADGTDLDLIGLPEVSHPTQTDVVEQRLRMCFRDDWITLPKGYPARNFVDDVAFFACEHVDQDLRKVLLDF